MTFSTLTSVFVSLFLHPRRSPRDNDPSRRYDGLGISVHPSAFLRLSCLAKLLKPRGRAWVLTSYFHYPQDGTSFPSVAPTYGYVNNFGSGPDGHKVRLKSFNTLDMFYLPTSVFLHLSDETFHYAAISNI